jgi:hypothetical protein
MLGFKKQWHKKRRRGGAIWTQTKQSGFCGAVSENQKCGCFVVSKKKYC